MTQQITDKGQVELASLRLERDQLRSALEDAVSVGKTAFELWDSDQDAKVGKYLKALTGDLPGYDGRTDAIHKAMAASKKGGA